MVRTKDHMLYVYRHREDPAVREAYVLEKEQEAEARRAEGRKAKKAAPGARGKKRTGLISLSIPESISAGQPVTVEVQHKLGAELGEQLVHVTLKAGPDGERVDRKIVTVSGNGVTEVTFDVPATVPGGVVSFAAFVGKDYPASLQHIQTDPVPAK